MEVKVASWLYYDISRECALLCYIRNLCETLERKPEAPDSHAAMPPAPLWVPSQRPLATSVASVTSVANDKGDNEMILGAVHRSPGICLTTGEKPRKLQLGDSLMKGLCEQSSPQMRLFPPNEVGRKAYYVRK